MLVRQIFSTYCIKTWKHELQGKREKTSLFCTRMNMLNWRVQLTAQCFFPSWNMSKCVDDRTRSWSGSRWGNSSWWPVRPMSLCFREFLGQSVLRCCGWEPPTCNSFLMMYGATAVHSVHCKSITWDVNADEWHTHSKRRWKCQSSSLLSCFLITLCHSHWAGGHFEDILKM